MRKITLFLLVIALLTQIAGAADTNYVCFRFCGWTASTFQKYETLKEIGYDDTLAIEIVNSCKSTARDPDHCIRTVSALGKAESSACKRTEGNDCFGISGVSYESKEAGIRDVVERYNRLWWKAKSGAFFYGPHKKGTSYYCTDERSSKTVGWCPNGKKHFDSIFFKK